MAEGEGKLPEDTEQQPGNTGGGDEELPPAPAWMLDEPPETGKKMDSIKWGLMHGKTEEELVEIGYNKKTVSMAAFELEKDGYRERPRKQRASRKAVAEKPGGSPSSIETVTRRALSGQTKAIPPEFLIDQIVLPLDGGQAKNFETGMKFGLRVAVLGVRLAQELGALNMAQVNPIITMANAMRQGEAMAAKEAAAEAAVLAANEVGEKLMPALASLGKAPATGDPMKQMMVDTMRPIFKRMMDMMMPGFGGGQVGGVPQGWTRRVEEEEQKVE